MSTIIIPFILSERRRLPTYDGPIDEPNTKQHHDVLSFDNEDIIASNLYDEDLLQLFRSNNIVAAKVPAGNTRIHNGSDLHTIFKTTKKDVKVIRINDVDVLVGNEHVQANIYQAFKNLKARYPGLSIGAGHIDNIISGSLTLLYVYRDRHSPNVYIQRFVKGGQHCSPNPDTGLTIDFDKMMGQCYSKVPTVELNRMKEEAGRLVYEYVIPNDRFLLRKALPPALLR